jgi:hypothetical protein
MRTPLPPSLWRGRLRMETANGRESTRMNSRNRLRQGYVGQERSQRTQKGLLWDDGCRGEGVRR